MLGRASFVLALCACSAPEPGSAPAPLCAGIYVDHVVAEASTVAFISPDCLVQAAEGWGPQTLGLSIEHDFSPQISYTDLPSLSKSKNDITRTVQRAVGFSLTHTIDLDATTLVQVPTDAFYRLEAYPTYQVVRWDLRADACGFSPDMLLTSGAAYRPIGIDFRVMVWVSGAWNALRPPGPTELPYAPWSPAPPDAGADGG
jgi:hypothetical protein